MKEDAVFLRHVLNCIKRIKEDVAGRRDSFMVSHTIQDAVLRNLQVIAESTQRLSEEIKATQPEIEWRRIAAFRNVLVHNYLGIDIEKIWDVVQRDIPVLEQAVSRMLARQP
ncbi:MAG: DUF86 domain-containing protein [Acidobacteria bacterium]|nr:MAG: DUF86 domain-containing protein [Acidobacteriota bacterium]